MAELCLALEAEADLSWYLDLTTGDVILLTPEYEAAEYGGIDAVELQTNEARFRRVPTPDPKAAMADMQAFVGGLSDSQLRESLELALSAPRPERRFRAALGWIPDQLQKWHAFRQSRAEARALAWLESLRVNPIARPAASDEFFKT